MLKIEETKNVWVAWTNTDLTEGRGVEYPCAVCETETTAIRLGKKRSIQGGNCRITKEIAVKVDGKFYYPSRFHYPSTEDKNIDYRNKKRARAQEKARAAGLTEEDIELLLGKR